MDTWAVDVLCGQEGEGKASLVQIGIADAPWESYNIKPQYQSQPPIIRIRLVLT